MKDIIIKWKWIKREMILVLLFYIAANLVNLISIIIYQSQWDELCTSQGFVLYLTEWLYITGIVFRIIYWGIQYLIYRK